MKCTNEKIGQMVALHEFGGLDERDERAVLDHLVECEYCYAQVYSLEPAMASFRRHRAESRRQRAAAQARARQTRKGSASVLIRPDLWRMWHGVPAVAALSLMIVAAAAAVYMIAHGPRTDGIKPGAGGKVAANQSLWKDLEVPKAAYSAPPSDLRLRGPGEAFQRAMLAYQANDFKSASEQLETLREMALPNAAEVNFYLGVSLLMIGNAHESLTPLERTGEQGDSIRREAAHYYLGLAYAKDSSPQQAIVELDKAIEMSGEHQIAARTLRDRIVEATR